MSTAPKVSVVIATYMPGAAFDRVIASLDAQTLPQEEFETIVVDDGSPDDTPDRLAVLAATRPNMRVERIENSGWPSRPRNIGVGLARGDSVLFMDHDDSLYPDALRRMAAYAAETGADLLSPKESKTTDAWWNMPTLAAGNVPNILVDGGIAQLLPMVPHKLYRREFLAEHGIAFPEGRRRLWEDIVVNVTAWRHAERVAVLADTPVYLWHSSTGNNSKSYGPLSQEYWDRLDDLFADIDRILDGAPHEDAQRTSLLHQYQGRVLGRLSRVLGGAAPEEAATAIARARAVQDRFVPASWDALLAPFDRARAVLLRTGRGDLLAALAAVDADATPIVTATGARWRDGRLRLDVEARWCTRAGEPITFRREGSRMARALPDELQAALPDDVLDLAGTVGEFRVGIGVRDRAAAVTWAIPVESRAEWLDVGDDLVTPLLIGTATLDPASAVFGRPLDDRVHDLVTGVEWNAADYLPGTLRYGGPAAPAMVGERPAVAYASTKGTLALDLSSSLRNVLADGGAPAGRVAGTLAALTLPLPRVATSGRVALPAAARLSRAGGDPIELPGVLIAEPQGARLEVGTRSRVPSGDYELAFRVGDNPFFGTRPVQVAGKALTIQPKPGTAPASPERAGGGVLGAVRRRLGT